MKPKPVVQCTCTFTCTCTFIFTTCTHVCIIVSLHVGVAKLLLDYGANINTHSNEFKESALTLACYKGHLDMVKFLLDAGVCLCVCVCMRVCMFVSSDS